MRLSCIRSICNETRCSASENDLYGVNRRISVAIRPVKVEGRG